MFGNVVCGVPGERFEEAIADAKRERGVTLDTELDVDALRALTHRFKALYDFPADPREQLERAIRAVFDSWSGARAVAYRRINGIPDEWGTAVNVQQMVFGNRGGRSCSGVAFSRDEITGAPEPSGDFLANAQGEDVVSGVRTPNDLAELRDWMPEVHAQLMDILRTLERHYGDMQDTEFTVEEGRLYMLQTRSAKRPAQAAVRFAADAVEEGLLTRAEAIQTIDAGRLDALLHPTFDPDAHYEVLARGVAASPGAAKGRIVFTAEDAVAAAAEGRAVILVRPFTEADDVAGFHAARGILTSEGGKASHAALVARGMGRPAVTGAAALDVDLHAGEVRIGERVLHAGDLIAIDGTTGAVTTDDVPLVAPPVDPRFETVLVVVRRPAHARRARQRRHARATRGARARSAPRASGCAGRSTCSWPPTASPRCRRRSWPRTMPTGARRSIELLPLQQADFEGMFEAMDELPVTIRLLDPPLHEFLPDRFELVERLTEARLRRDGRGRRARARPRADARRSRRATRCWARAACGSASSTPTSTRCRRGRSSAPRAPCVRAPARRRRVEVMIPLVAYARELELARALVERVAAEEGWDGELKVGTMIELPRACLVAGTLAPQRRLLLVRHQRPHPDRARLLARRHRGADRPALRRPRHRRALARSARSTRTASAS